MVSLMFIYSSLSSAFVLFGHGEELPMYALQDDRKDSLVSGMIAVVYCPVQNHHGLHKWCPYPSPSSAGTFQTREGQEGFKA